MNEKPQQTQGQIKTRIRLKELLENENFKKELQVILEVKNRHKQSKMTWKFAEKYSLEFEPGSLLFDLIIGQKPRIEEQIGHELDVCELYDEPDEYLNENFSIDFDFPPSRNPRRRVQIMAFPIHIGISPQATKRDVLDFVTKRWDYIRYMLDCYLEKPKIIRIKPKAERDEMIWQNRDLGAAEIANLVSSKYPNENITYSIVKTE